MSADRDEFAVRSGIADCGTVRKQGGNLKLEVLSQYVGVAPGAALVAGAVAALTVSWVDGDWKLDVTPSGGLTGPAQAISSTVGYIAALVYGAAILSVTNSADITGEITGIVLVALATLTLPALKRMVAPMVSAIGNISAASAVGMVAGVASGAATVVATGGAAGPMAAAGPGHQAGNLGSQALGSSGGGTDSMASGSALPGAGAAGPAPAPATDGAAVRTTNGSVSNG